MELTRLTQEKTVSTRLGDLEGVMGTVAILLQYY